MASWDNARFDFKPDFTLDSKIKEAATTANKGAYDFAQQKALNRAWSNALDLSNGGRPSEAAFLQGAKDAGLSPEATDTYRKYLANAFSTGSMLAGDAMGMTSMGGSPTTILGNAPTPTVTETPAVGGPAGDWLRPSAQLQAPANPAPPVPANETRRTDEENEVHVKPEQGIAPTGGMFQLPAPVEPERTYSAPPQEGVFTQYARGIDPVGAMTQMQSAGGAPGASAPAGPALSPGNMNPMEQDYQQRALARSGVPGATLQEQMGNLEKIAERSVRAPVPYNPQAAMAGGRYDQAAAAKEMNRAREDVARYNAEKSAAVQKLAGQFLGNYNDVQGATIARAGAESSLNEAARPREAINQQVSALNQELGTSFDPSKMGDEKTANDVIERVRLQKNLLDRTQKIDVVRDESGGINGRATLAQIVPLLEGMGKLEGLPGTEGSLHMMVNLLAPSLDLSTMLATGMLDKTSGLTDKGFTYIASQFNNIPIEQVRKLAAHMVDASPGMAGIYQNYQSAQPRPLATVNLDAGSAPIPRRDPLGSFLRPSQAPAAPPAQPVAPKAAPDIRSPAKPLPKAGAISQSGKFFDGKNWREPKPGDEDRKGRTYTGKRWI